MFKFFKNIYYSMGAYFHKKKEERIANQYSKIYNRLSHLKSLKDKSLPITQQNAHYHSNIINKVERLCDKAKRLSHSYLYSAFKEKEPYIRESIKKTRDQIKHVAPLAVFRKSKPFNFTFTKY